MNIVHPNKQVLIIYIHINGKQKTHVIAKNIYSLVNVLERQIVGAFFFQN
jgi:hypothetical protein